MSSFCNQSPVSGCRFEPELWKSVDNLRESDPRYNGYFQCDKRKFCVNGKAYLATSRIDENKFDPADYLANSNAPAPWKIEDWDGWEERELHPVVIAYPRSADEDQEHDEFVIDARESQGNYDKMVIEWASQHSNNQNYTSPEWEMLGVNEPLIVINDEEKLLTGGAVRVTLYDVDGCYSRSDEVWLNSAKDQIMHPEIVAHCYGAGKETGEGGQWCCVDNEIVIDATATTGTYEDFVIEWSSDYLDKGANESTWIELIHNGDLHTTLNDPELVAKGGAARITITNGPHVKHAIAIVEPCNSDCCMNPDVNAYCMQEDDGVPMDKIVIDASHSSGNFTSAKIEFSKDYVTKMPSNDPTWELLEEWPDKPHAKDLIAVIEDTACLEQGGVARITLCNEDHCVVQTEHIAPCLETTEDWLDYEGEHVFGGSGCIQIDLTKDTHYQIDGMPDFFTPSANNGYTAVEITNTDDAPAVYMVESHTSLNRVHDTGDGWDFGGLPKTRAMHQARMGFLGDELLDYRYLHNQGTVPLLWVQDRTVDDVFSGYVESGGPWNTGQGGNKFNGVVTNTNTRMFITLQPGETQTIVTKIHVYYEVPHDPEDSNLVGFERIHWACSTYAKRIH